MGGRVWSIESPLRGEPPGQPGRTHTWTSAWHRWPGVVDRAEIRVEAAIDLFDNKTIETVVDGSQRPFTDADGVPHTWYGRCMIAIVDERRWIMALRSGVSHISWGDRDAIHLITSTDEGRTWGGLNRWFDGSPIRGLPYQDGHTHSEPGLYAMPNGDLVLQCWRTGYTSGTRQMRSTDGGRTWRTDADRVCVAGVAGAEGDLALGTEDWFVDPEHPADVYLAFQYFHYRSTSGTLLARSRDDGRSYRFVSWIVPPAPEHDPAGRATFEPAIEYVGDRTIVAVLRDAARRERGDPGCTWQAVSTDMGESFAPPVDISDRIDGGVAGGLWQRARLYLESNPAFQHGNRLDFTAGEGRLWGFGLHSIGGGYTRKPVVYHSHDRGQTWRGPELLHGPMLRACDVTRSPVRRNSEAGNSDSRREIARLSTGSGGQQTYYQPLLPRAPPRPEGGRMKTAPIRWNVILLSIIAGAVMWVAARTLGDDVPIVVVSLMSTFAGGLVAIAKDLIAPDQPEPKKRRGLVPADTHRRILAIITGGTYATPEGAPVVTEALPRHPQMRFNALWLAALAAAVAITAAELLGETQADLVAALMSAVVGGLLVTIKDMIRPDPPEPEEDEETIPADLHEETVRAAIQLRRTGSATS